ncbi:hydroxyisourate hydrolase [Euzebya tangerina]|uniref:hydroxyisourate hydrolase n=1 Tax=Euzebya tangerina TaxID=591198 RepID=UPI00196B8120|nr:hydroxyisourate hydrolase [Euzebya tangerina]
MSLSTHVLDTATGRPASGIVVRAEFAADPTAADSWSETGTGTTDADGRIGDLLSGDLRPGTHRVTFATGPYFADRGVEAFWGDVTITFHVTDPADHYHVPLLLSPYGYSTYRGS